MRGTWTNLVQSILASACSQQFRAAADRVSVAWELEALMFLGLSACEVWAGITFVI